jgi:hypothetical protein
MKRYFYKKTKIFNFRFFFVSLQIAKNKKNEIYHDNKQLSIPPQRANRCRTS